MTAGVRIHFVYDSISVQLPVVDIEAGHASCLMRGKSPYRVRIRVIGCSMIMVIVNPCVYLILSWSPTVLEIDHINISRQVDVKQDIQHI